MARLLGLIANRPDLCNRFAEWERAALAARRDLEEPWGWGVGFFQSGEILLKRRPLDDSRALDFATMIGDVRSDTLIAHIRRATVGELRTDNTHPFRYRHWIFASKGTVSAWVDVRHKLYESLPQFLKRSLRGETDSELLFHLFLSFLHDGGKLDHHNVSVSDAFGALKSSLGLLDRIAKESGVGATRLNILMATPDYLLASHRGEPMAYRLLHGREDLEPLFAQKGSEKLRMPDLEPCRLAVVASDFESDGIPQGWTEVPMGAMIAFSRTHEPTIVQT
jgi:glutamine amidotransferase